MSWPEFSLKHKYTVFALIIALVFFGIFSKSTLKTELFPDTAPPLVNVMTAYPGASAQDVVDNLSTPLEEEFATVEGVKKIKSTSQEGLSVVKVEFHYGASVDLAAVDIQNAISRIKKTLPQDIHEPQVLKFSTSAKPIVTYGLSSKEFDLTEVRNLAENELKSELQLVEGVAAVDVFGGYKKQINVLIDKKRLEALEVSLDEVTKAIQGNNIAAPGGRITQGDREYLIRINEKLDNWEQLGQIVIKNRKGSVVYLRDVARVEDSMAERRSEYRLNGQNSIALQIIKKDDANTVDVVERVDEKVAELKKQYPYLDFVTADDDSDFTKQVISNMTSSIGLALFLTALIILFFLVSINQSLVVAVSMPLSFLATLCLMKLTGMELNLITLSALILSIGMVVDNAIVVVENIVRRHKEMAEDIHKSALEGTKEVMLPVIAGTATTVIVLIPLLFIQGFVGKVFGPLAGTLILALLSSLFVSLTIIPLFTVLLGNKSWAAGENFISKAAGPFNKLMDLIRQGYLGLLEKALKRRRAVIIGSVILLVGSMRLLALIGMEVLPKLDSGSFFISVQTTPGTSLERTGAIVGQIEKMLQQEAEVKTYSAQMGYETGSHYLGDSGAMGVNQAFITATLTSRKERKESIWEIEDMLRAEISRLPGIDTFVIKESGGTAVATTTAPLDIRISGPDERVLARLAEEVAQRAAGVPGAVNIYQSWSMNTTQINVDIDEERAAMLGLNPAFISGQIAKSLEGAQIDALSSSGREDTDIFIRYDHEDRLTEGDILDTKISTPPGLIIPLRHVADLKTGPGVQLSTREDLQKTVDILGYTYQRAFSHVVADIEQEIKSITLPEGYSIAVVGEQADLQESKQDMLFALSLAILAVYLFLLAQFKSFSYPVVIMTAIPLMLIGVATALLLSGKAVSMPVLLGLILLAGTVINNSIMLIDFIIKRKEEGMDTKQAILQSVALRYRPIMMTVLSDVAGMFPLAAEMALGSERFSPLATAVIGGILASTLLTMIVVPVVFSLVEDLKVLISKRLTYGNVKHY